MTNQKKRLKDWLTDFVRIAVELSPDLRIPVNTGQAVLIVPADVCEILKKKRIVFDQNDKTFFEFETEIGQTLLEVVGENDPWFSLRLILQKSKA